MKRSSRQPTEFLTRVQTWSDLSNLIEHFSYFSGHAWLFRGGTDAAYKLVPKIGRTTSRATTTKGKRETRVPYRLDDELAVFRMFKQQARSHISAPPATELEWLAVAQHHGLPTRLLDWTESLLVATWFAVEKGGGKNHKEDSAVWVATHLDSLDADSTSDPFGIGKPVVYRPAHVSGRIVAQTSVLMVCPDPTEEVLPQFVKKIVIAREIEFTLKKRLNAIGINRRHLFPDLSGLAEHLSWLYKRDYLAGYREQSGSKISPTPDTPKE